MTESTSPEDISISIEDIRTPLTQDASLSQSASWKKAEKEEEELKFESLRQQIDFSKDNHQQRRSYAKYIFVLICFWLTAVLIICLIQGFSRFDKFSLSTTVLVTLLGTTTANVIAVLIIVLRYVFPTK